MHTSRKNWLARPRCSRKQVLETSRTKHVVWQLARSVIRLHLTSTLVALSPLVLLLSFLIISARSPLHQPVLRSPRDVHAPMQLILIVALQQATRKQPVFIAHLCSWTRAVDLGDGAWSKLRSRRDRFDRGYGRVTVLDLISCIPPVSR